MLMFHFYIIYFNFLLIKHVLVSECTSYRTALSNIFQMHFDESDHKVFPDLEWTDEDHDVGVFSLFSLRWSFKSLLLLLLSCIFLADEASSSVE